MEARVGKVGAVGVVRGRQARETRRWNGQDEDKIGQSLWLDVRLEGVV